MLSCVCWQVHEKEIHIKKLEDEAEYLTSTVREQEQRLIVLSELELRVAELKVSEEVLHNQINTEMEESKRLQQERDSAVAALEEEQAKRKALEEKSTGRRVRKTEKSSAPKRTEAESTHAEASTEDGKRW